MVLINQKVKLLRKKDQTGTDILKQVEYAGRNCWQSRDKITDDSYERFIKSLIERGHESPLEFGDLYFDLTTSRAVMAELTRHRLASFQIESQRYVLQSKEGGLKVIMPEWFDIENPTDDASIQFIDTVNRIERGYKALIESGKKPEEARELLPNCTACNIIVKANLREWRHIFELRCSKNAYPQMRTLAKEMLTQAKEYCPVVFDDLYEKYITQGD